MAEHSHEHDAHGGGTVDETPVNNSSIAGWGLAVAVLFFGSAAALSSVFLRLTDDAVNEKVLSVGSPELQQLRGEEIKRLTTVGYVDKDKQLAHIPIEEGMRRVIAEAEAQAQAPAPVPAPTPAPGDPAK